MAKKNTAIKAENMAENMAITEAEHKAEQAAIALHKAGMTALIDAMLHKAGVAITEAEHSEARPLSEADKAKAALAAIGLDLASLTADKATAGNLAISVDGLARAFGKYGKHVFAADTANGTSLVTHNVAAQLLSTGKCLLPEVLKAVRQHLPNYSSTGHYNTLKRMLKAEGYKLNVWQAGFSITK